MPRGQYSKTYDMTDVVPYYPNNILLCENCIFLGRFRNPSAPTIEQPREDLYVCGYHTNSVWHPDDYPHEPIVGGALGKHELQWYWAFHVKNTTSNYRFSVSAREAFRRAKARGLL